LKPPVPYVKGWRFTARAHIPPPPTPLTPGSCLNGEAGRLERNQLHPVERCLLHSPLPGSDGDFSVDLEIDNLLRVGEDRNAQVVLVHLLKHDSYFGDLAEGTHIVAKIYDPLYFSDDEGYLNPFLLADTYYTHETATYTALSDLQGSLIPRYYGSFTLDITVRPSTTRSVRLILIEFILGSSMLDTDPANVPQWKRQQIMKTVVDFESLLFARDIIHIDLHPRNIILVNAVESDQQKPLVVFIDFADVQFGRTSYYPNVATEEEFFPGTYISPLLRWHSAHKLTWEFEDWIDWDWQSWLEEEYRHTAASITKEMRDLFLPDFLLRPVGPPPND
jgi:hypothetical protein